MTPPGLRFVSCLFAVVLLAVVALGYPAVTGNNGVVYNLPAIENMRQIPQWHCLRYRKFDYVRRCRNFRLGRRN